MLIVIIGVAGVMDVTVFVASATGTQAQPNGKKAEDPHEQRQTERCRSGDILMAGRRDEEADDEDQHQGRDAREP